MEGGFPIGTAPTPGFGMGASLPPPEVGVEAGFQDALIRSVALLPGATALPPQAAPVTTVSPPPPTFTAPAFTAPAFTAPAFTSPATPPLPLGWEGLAGSEALALPGVPPLLEAGAPPEGPPAAPKLAGPTPIPAPNPPLASPSSEIVPPGGPPPTSVTLTLPEAGPDVAAPTPPEAETEADAADPDAPLPEEGATAQERTAPPAVALPPLPMPMPMPALTGTALPQAQQDAAAEVTPAALPVVAPGLTPRVPPLNAAPPAVEEESPDNLPGPIPPPSATRAPARPPSADAPALATRGLDGMDDAIPAEEAAPEGAMPLPQARSPNAPEAGMAAMEPRPSLPPPAAPSPQAMIVPGFAAEAAPAPIRAAEAAPPVTSPPAPPPPPIRQVAPIAVALAFLPGGAGGFQLSLDPVELGRVEIRVQREGDSHAVRIVAERPETLALLLRDRQELDRGLADAGLRVEAKGIEFSLGGSSGQGEQRPQGEPREPRQGAAAPHAGGRAAAAEAMPARVLRGLLDLNI